MFTIYIGKTSGYIISDDIKHFNMPNNRIYKNFLLITDIRGLVGPCAIALIREITIATQEEIEDYLN